MKIFKLVCLCRKNCQSNCRLWFYCTLLKKIMMFEKIVKLLTFTKTSNFISTPHRRQRKKHVIYVHAGEKSIQLRDVEQQWMWQINFYNSGDLLMAIFFHYEIVLKSFLSIHTKTSHEFSFMRNYLKI